jgi:hypothetical protein
MIILLLWLLCGSYASVLNLLDEHIKDDTVSYLLINTLGLPLGGGISLICIVLNKTAPTLLNLKFYYKKG